MLKVQTKTWMENALNEVLQPQATTHTYEKYFDPDYVQVVDGKTLDYAEATHHFGIVRDKMTSLRITINDFVADGDTIAESHIVDGETKDGEIVQFEVIAITRLKDGRIWRLNELTRQIKGGEHSRDLGSRT
ncbi:nuclear transport factor 2 family protein [Massilia sp. MB5]|uniref:nuclear transport factor 2 family protein n=1 Tax=unclassified Massilia TaxID=2609279 RepID=UPI00067D549E|nr:MULTISPECIES: nuclear transport factor 2 family protein [unclassified Massilia]UMR32377.1 nuclear transport factor 2 family protein [Massilia sp. MB5]